MTSKQAFLKASTIFVLVASIEGRGYVRTYVHTCSRVCICAVYLLGGRGAYNRGKHTYARTWGSKRGGGLFSGGYGIYSARDPAQTTPYPVLILQETPCSWYFSVLISHRIDYLLLTFWEMVNSVQCILFTISLKNFAIGHTQERHSWVCPMA